MSSSSRRNAQRANVPPTPTIGGTCFPDDVMLEILSRVPVEPLTRMKLVNKAWESTISSRIFAGVLHLNMMRSMNHVGYVLQAQMGFYPIAYDYSPPWIEGNLRNLMDGDPLFSTLASCNGFLLVSTIDDHFIIANPSICECWEIPTPKIIFPDHAISCTAFYGMGWVSTTGEYKVVRIVLFNSVEFKSVVEVFSTFTRTWRYIGEFPYEYPVWSPGIFVGGGIHWQISSFNVIHSIGRFDCMHETFSLIPLPQGQFRISSYGELTCIDDENLAVYTNLCYTFDEFELWVLNSTRNPCTWTRIILAPGYQLGADEILLGIQPLRLLKPDHRRLLFRTEPSGRFVEYDLVDRTYIPVQAPDWTNDCCTVFSFIQSVERLG